MRISISIALSWVSMTLLSGCGQKITLPDHPIVFESRSNENYIETIWEERVYVPYCSGGLDKIGNCLGYIEENGEIQEYIFELEGELVEEWLVGIVDSGGCNTGMILREINTEDIPQGFESDYIWNQ